MPIVTYIVRIAEARLPTDLLGKRSLEVRKESGLVSDICFEIISAAIAILNLNKAFLSNADGGIPSRAS